MRTRRGGNNGNANGGKESTTTTASNNPIPPPTALRGGGVSKKTKAVAQKNSDGRGRGGRRSSRVSATRHDGGAGGPDTLQQQQQQEETEKKRDGERVTVSSWFGATCRLSTIVNHRDMAYVAHELLYAKEGADAQTTTRQRATAVELSYYQYMPATALVELTFAVAFEGVATTADAVAARATHMLNTFGHFLADDRPIEVAAFPLASADQARRARAVMDERLGKSSRVSSDQAPPLPRIRCSPFLLFNLSSPIDDRHLFALSFPVERAYMPYFCPMREEDWATGGEPRDVLLGKRDFIREEQQTLLSQQTERQEVLLRDRKHQDQEQQQQEQQQENTSSPPALRTIQRHPDPAARQKVRAMLDESAGIPFKCPSLAKVQRWLDTVARLPLGMYSPSLEPTRQELERARADMDAVVHGVCVAKTAALEMAAKLQLAPSAPMRALLLEGPPGCGKTTFATRALGRALRRPVRVINLGGVKDSAMLLGHNYTYEGSRPGRVVEELCAARVSDPVLVFDEVDKVSDTSGGREIEHVLMALIDPVQNAEFVDNYLYGVPLDLSRALIVFTCNDVSAISAPLLDRLRVVTFAQPSAAQKRAATRDHVIPRVANAMGFLSPPPLLLPENANDRDAIVDRLVGFCSDHRSDDANGKGMRGIEKTIERVLMNASIRRILSLPPSPPSPPSHHPSSASSASSVAVDAPSTVLITRADVDSTLSIMRHEMRESEQARHSAAEGGVDAYVRHSMYT